MAQRDIGNLRTRLSWEDEGAQRSLEGFRRDLRGLRSEMNVLRSRGREYTASLKGLRQQADILNRTYKTQQERVRELRKRYEESVKVKGEDANQTRDLNRQYNNAVAEMNRTEEQLKRLNSAIEEQTNPWKRLSRNMTETGEKLQSIGREMTDFGKSYSLRVTAPIVAGGTAMFKAAMDYESAFAGVRKTVDASEEEFAALSKGIRDMAKELPTAATDIAAVAESAGQLGIQNDAILGFTRTIIDLGEATNLTREQAATEFARFANIVEMSQDNFNRLGSSVVALGNNMATTEAEIVSMGMRLAAQGSLVGMTEAQIMALAATMSSLGIEAEAGGTAMTTALKKIEAAVDEGGEKLNGFAKVAGVSSKEFADVWSKEPIQALDMFIKGLAESGQEGENLSSILADLGIKGIRETDTILRLAGASDLLSEAVNISSKAWEENIALTDEAEQRYKTTESQMKILWNRVQDVAITLGQALVPAVMDAIDAAEPLIRKIEEGTQAFADMSEEEQQTILKMIGLVAAIGPASIALGNLTTAIGGVLKVGGSLAGLLGRVGGTGLLGRIGMLGISGGPVGLAIAGLAGLTAATLSVTAANKETKEVTLETANAWKAQSDELETIIGRYDELRAQNMLTNDELARFIDLNAELQETENEEKIAAIQKEMDKLREKSGLSNEELDEMVALNDKLIELVPGATDKITDQGNKLVESTGKAKEYNAKLKEMTIRELEVQKLRAESNQQKIQEEINKLQDQLNEGLEKERELRNEIANYDLEELERRKEKLEAQLESNQLSDYHEAAIRAQILALEEEYDRLKENLATQIEQNDKTREAIEQKEAELGKLDEIKQALVDQYLQQVGINSEKGNGLELLDDEISKLEKQKTQLREKRDNQEISNSEYREGVEELDREINNLESVREKIKGVISETGRQNSSIREGNRQYNHMQDNIRNIRSAQHGTNEEIDRGTDKARNMTRELGKDVTKNVKVDDRGTAQKVQREAEKPAVKRVTLRATWQGLRTGLSVALSAAFRGATPRFAKGTNFAPGGPALVGEEGPELARLGNRWAMLDFGITDIPRGTQIFTHDETKKIVAALNRLPAYANGISYPGEADRVVQQLNEAQTVPLTGEAIIYTTVINQMDGREISRQIYRHVTELQQRETSRIARARGEG